MQEKSERLLIDGGGLGMTPHPEQASLLQLNQILAGMVRRVGFHGFVALL